MYFTDVEKVLYSQAIGGVIFALIGGTPQIVLLTTAPLALYTKSKWKMIYWKSFNFLQQSNLHVLWYKFEERKNHKLCCTSRERAIYCKTVLNYWMRHFYVFSKHSYMLFKWMGRLILVLFLIFSNLQHMWRLWPGLSGHVLLCRALEYIFLVPVLCIWSQCGDEVVYKVSSP